MIQILLLIGLNLLHSEIIIPQPDSTIWNVLVNGNIQVSWTDYKGVEWCKAKSPISASIFEVENIIQDKENYPNVFKRVDSATIITKDIVHLALDMPFPFSGRDYVVQYFAHEENGYKIYRYQAVTDPVVEINDDYIRLINAAGEWRLKSLDSNKTEVSYIWNGELLGEFPDWALSQAWETQGIEVLTWLEEAVNNE